MHSNFKRMFISVLSFVLVIFSLPIKGGSNVAADNVYSNIALSSTVEAETPTWAANAGYDSTNLNDGEINQTGYGFYTSTYMEDATAEKVITMTFDKAYKVNEVVLYGRNRSGAYCGIPEDFTIEVWNGAEWTEVASKTGYDNSLSSLSVTFDATDCRELKLISKKMSLADSGPKYAVQIIEMQVMGCETDVNLPSESELDYSNIATLSTVEAECPSWAVNAALGADNLIDGVTAASGNEFYTSTYEVDATTYKTILMTFDKTYKINEVILYARSNDGYCGIPEDFTIEVWKGTEWVEVASKTGYDNSVKTLSVTFDAIDCRAVRLVSQKMCLADGGPKYAIQIAEMEVMGMYSFEDINVPDRDELYTYQVLAGNNNGGDSIYSNYRIPGIVVTDNDTVIMYYEARTSSSDWADIDILAFRSTDGGTTWSEPINLAEGSDTGVTMNNPVMIVGNDNIIHFIYCVEYGVCTECGSSATSLCSHGAGAFYRRSSDDGLTWSEAVNISDSTAPDMRNVIATGPGHGIALSNGTLVVPVWLVKKEENASLQSHSPSEVTTLYSTDNGDSWQLGEFVPNNSEDGIVITSPNETMAVECSDGSVMLNIRTAGDGYRAVAWSPDGYSDWTEMDFDKTLIDPACMGSVTKYDIEDDPYTVLFANCESTSSRKNLVLKGSFDNGKSWSVRKVIDSGVAGYSDIAVDSRGNIYIIYEVNAGATVNLARMNFDCLCSDLDVSLSCLEINEISDDFEFNSITEEYTVSANYGDKFIVNARSFNTNASIEINGELYEMGTDFDYVFKIGYDTLKIDVSYGEMSKTYTITFKPLTSLNEQLILYLNGETCQDQTLFGNDAVLNDSVKYNTENFAFGSGSYEFDGNDGDSAYINIPSINGFGFGTENFSFSVWVNFDSMTGSVNNQQIIFWHGGLGSGKSQLWCRSNSSDLQCCLSSGGNETVLTASGVLSAGKWYHITIVRDELNLYMYLNNELVASGECPYIYDLSPDSMNIAASQNTTPNRILDGCIDEFKIYNFALCKRQIKSLYENNAAEKSQHLIYQFEPWKMGQKENQNITGTVSDMPSSEYETYIRKNDDGLYYSIEAAAYSNKTYSYLNTGYTYDNFPLLGNTTVMEALLPYMQISVDVRINSENVLAENIEFSILSMQDSQQSFEYAGGSVTCDGEWYTFTQDGVNGSVSDLYQGTLAVILSNANDSSVNFDFRNFTVSLKGSDQDTIDELLSDTELSYEKLINYVENDVNDDGKFNVSDLVRLKKISAGIISYTPDYVLDRIDKDETGYINAGDLINIRKALLKGL